MIQWRLRPHLNEYRQGREVKDVHVIICENQHWTAESSLPMTTIAPTPFLMHMVAASSSVLAAICLGHNVQKRGCAAASYAEDSVDANPSVL